MKLLAILAVVGLGLGFASAQEAAIKNFRAGILTKDQQPTAENLKTLPLFSKLPSDLSADALQRLYVTFDVNEKAGGAVAKPQQVFLRFEAENGDDAVFTLNADRQGSYVHDSVLRTASKLFHNVVGKFKLHLIVADAALKNPVNWYFGNIVLDRLSHEELLPKSKQVHYEPLKEITHVFRQPEKRPSAVISDLFTVICLLPLLILFALWFKIGINFEEAPLSLWVPIFHFGLLGIFGLYFFFWIQFDMFETLRYLAFLGFFTFLAGNRVLRSLAGNKLKSD
uniref:Dolichyl-diphosphooligosaccharide--protein glycosyltransferase subunit 2 n=1 Tax=Caenorhabditis japonica TaxID=281687 RepID=A0A8R1DMB4_CAEJA